MGGWRKKFGKGVVDVHNVGFLSIRVGVDGVTRVRMDSNDSMGQIGWLAASLPSLVGLFAISDESLMCGFSIDYHTPSPTK